eukprot:comp18935_c0_seq1/m.21153 comp18935_c0_seq1/g.21153  ORF comp18935_c0_seq1/g.21153 comp18935_c0_seq1/m.21153 type:complete len:225 (-) comp18935_c0_seq1:638-1312(-)
MCKPRFFSDPAQIAQTAAKTTTKREGVTEVVHNAGTKAKRSLSSLQAYVHTAKHKITAAAHSLHHHVNTHDEQEKNNTFTTLFDYSCRHSDLSHRPSFYETAPDVSSLSGHKTNLYHRSESAPSMSHSVCRTLSETYSPRVECNTWRFRSMLVGNESLQSITEGVKMGVPSFCDEKSEDPELCWYVPNMYTGTKASTAPVCRKTNDIDEDVWRSLEDEAAACVW